MNTQATISQSDSGAFKLSGALNMDTVMSCWPERDSVIEDAKSKNQKVTLDLAEVDQVDTAGLAWLVHLTRACHQQKVELNLANVPESLINLAKLSNLETVLPLH
ncbi:STAS domain-containing protein [Aliiglaciecola litoralis]|uniref:STAS domain-containing protein n=1 Tax=Aliiglaciecola litoralis TaxID=582857 RepID=A0ABN1LTM8_9ALTE